MTFLIYLVPELPTFVMIVIAVACIVTIAIVGLLCMFLCKYQVV